MDSRNINSMNIEQLYDFLTEKYSTELADKVKASNIDGKLFTVMCQSTSKHHYFSMLELSLVEMLKLESDFTAISPIITSKTPVTPSSHALVTGRHRLQLKMIRAESIKMWPDNHNLPRFDTDVNKDALAKLVSTLKSKSLFGHLDKKAIKAKVLSHMTDRRKTSRKIDFTTKKSNSMKLPKEIVTTPQKPNNNKDFEDEEESPFNSISPKRCAESSKESPEKISTYSTSTSTSTNKKLNMNMSEEEESQTQFNFPSPKIRKVSKDDQQRESSNISQSQTSSKFINQVNVEDLTNKDFENIARIFS
uniref:Uncharacterized protein n=3 Tax=Clytia hemisphaerica TaxID=252671 RepID=A0A7M5WW21_9CNID